MYMRSTMLYSILISCAVIAGTLSFASSLPTLIVPSCSVSFACNVNASLTPARGRSIIFSYNSILPNGFYFNHWRLRIYE